MSYARPRAVHGRAHGRAHWRALTACVVGALVAAPALHAQPVVRGAPRANSTAGATIEFLSQIIPSLPTVIPRARVRCAPGECFSQFVETKANANWQLEVRLRFPATGFTVDLSNTSTPSIRRARVLTAVWTPVYVSGAATANQTAEVTFYGAKTSGRSGRVPTSVDIGSLLEYRVVARP